MKTKKAESKFYGANACNFAGVCVCLSEIIENEIEMDPLAIILFAIIIGYCLFLLYGFILEWTASPEEKREWRKRRRERIKRKKAKRIEKSLRPKWYDYPGPGITD